MTPTKKCRLKLWIVRCIDAIALILPLLYYIALCYTGEEITSTSKISLTASLAIAGIILMLNIILKFKLRSPIWIILIGIYYCFGDIMLLVIMIAVGTILDEFLFTPLINRYKTELIANVAMDKRGL